MPTKRDLTFDAALESPRSREIAVRRLSDTRSFLRGFAMLATVAATADMWDGHTSGLSILIAAVLWSVATKYDAEVRVARAVEVVARMLERGEAPQLPE